MKITASIVIYNETEENLQKVIESFSGFTCEKELIIVDNSPQDILKSFCENFENIHYIFSGKNLGFGAGHNLAFKNLSIHSDLHLILNPDIFFNSKEIEEFLLWFYQSKEISLAIPKVLNTDGSIQAVVRNIPTPSSFIKRKLHIDSDEILIENAQIEEIPFAHGCFFAFKTEVFKKIDGFDERFFMYMEDVDIWIRAKKYGKTIINTNYQIYHQWEKGSSKSIKLFYYHITSIIKFFLKTYMGSY